VNNGGYSSNCKIVPAEFCIWWQNIHHHLENLWNRITTTIVDIFRIITLKQQNFLSPIQSWSANFQNNCSPIQSWSRQNWLQSCSSPIQSCPCSSLPYSHFKTKTPCNFVTQSIKITSHVVHFQSEKQKSLCIMLFFHLNCSDSGFVHL